MGMSARSLPPVSPANRTRAAPPAPPALAGPPAPPLRRPGGSGRGPPAPPPGAPGAAGAVSKPGGGPAGAPAPAGVSGQRAHLTVLPPPAGQAIIYTASLTVRAGDVRAAS